MKRFFVRVVFAVIIILGLSALMLYSSQKKLIYVPRHYTKENSPPASWTKLEYETSEGRQVAFLARSHGLAVQANILPQKIWLLFPGNSALAEQWSTFLKDYPNMDELFFLLDYPGYGFSEGSPSMTSIMDSAETGFQAMKNYFSPHFSSSEIDKIPLGLLAYSLGNATGLKFVSEYNIQLNYIILLAPFTSLLEMAEIRYGCPVCFLLTETYDNKMALADIMTKNSGIKLSVFHGLLDTIIPSSMGQELASAYHGASFFPIARARHDTLLTDSKEEIYEQMQK